MQLTTPRFKRLVPVLGLALTFGGGALAADGQNSFDPPFRHLAAAGDDMRLAQSQTDTETNDGGTWRQRGDRLAREGRYEKALQAYRRAEELGAGDEAMTVAIGDVLKALGREREAYFEFASLYDSPDPDTRETACQQMQYLGPQRHKVLPDPYFGEFYAQAGWQSIGDAAYVDSVARVGADMLPEQQLQVYGVARYIRDNRSGLVGGFPREYFDNVGVLGVGARSRPWSDVPLYVFAEAGRARDQIDLNRDRTRSDYRGGIQYYNEWFTSRACTGGVRYPMRFVMVASGESIYYSRYDDAVLSSVDLRPGIRLVETDFSSLDLSLMGSINTNSEADDFVQYKQAGVALTWVPDARNDLKFVAEATRTYFDNAENENNLSIYLVYSLYL